MPPLIIREANRAEQIRQRLNLLDLTPGMPDNGVFPRASRFGGLFFAANARSVLNPIPREQWAGLHKHLKGRTLRDLTAGKLPPHNQGRTNYCWAHAAARTAEIHYAMHRGILTPLSGESIAVPRTGGKNRGGTPDEAVAHLVAHGLCAADLWPQNDLNERHADPKWRTDARRRRLTLWLDVDSFDMMITLAFHDIPTATALSWWKHMVCTHSPEPLGRNEWGIGFDNSWGTSYGDNGYAVLDEQHAQPDWGCFAAIEYTFIDPEQAAYHG